MSQNRPSSLPNTGEHRERNTMAPPPRERSRGDDQDGGASASKRRRTAIACAACRIRKSRCNGNRPKCGLCESFDFECLYEVSGSGTNIIVRKDYMSDIEERLQILETKVNKHEGLFQSGNPGSNIPIGGDGDVRQSREPSTPENDSSNQSGPPGGTADFRSAAVREVSPEEALTDGMAVSFTDEEDYGFFGQSSNISFMRHISRAMIVAGNVGELRTPLKSDDYAFLDNGIVNASRAPSPDPKPMTSVSGSKYSKPQSGPSLNMLPSEPVVRELLGRYFSNTGLLFPYIHEPTFMNTYEQMKAANFTTVRRTWLGLLNMVLAMASNASSQHNPGKLAHDRIAESDVFYQRAIGLCQTQMLRGTGLETVQLLLLMSQYLQGTQKSVQTWAIHGLAVKAAYSIGLHSIDASRSCSPIEREIRKRTWFGCVVLDRTLSMTFGRPPAIPDDHVRLQLPQVLEDDSTSINSGALYYVEKTRSVSFYNATIALYKTTSKIISSLYGGNLGCDQQLTDKEMTRKIFQFEQEIDEWTSSLPPHLALITSSNIPHDITESVTIMRYRVVITLRYLNAQVLLYRPVLVRSIDQRTEAGGQLKVSRSVDQMQANYIRSCTTFAEEIITIVHEIVNSETLGKHLLGAWWFSLFYVFNAALIIFGTLLASLRHVDVSVNMRAQIEKCGFFLKKVVQVLKCLDEGNLTVQRCAIYLEQMSRSLESRLDAIAGNTDGNGGVPLINSQQLDLEIEGSAQVPGSLYNNEQGGFLYGPPQNVVTSFDGIFGGDLELGQFFTGGMESWIQSQQ